MSTDIACIIQRSILLLIINKNMNNTQDIIKALNWRYATKTFDATKSVSEEDIRAILDSGRLAPSSFGLEAWKFLVVKNPEIKIELRKASYDQTKVTDASHIVVLARRTDVENLVPELISRLSKNQNKDEKEFAGLQEMVSGTISSHEKNKNLDCWLSAQTYIALGFMMQTAALMNIDTCPMEGFDPNSVNNILGLKDKNLSVVTMLTVGYRGDDSYSQHKKTRRAFEEVVEFIS